MADGTRFIRLPPDPTDAQILEGVGQWLGLLAAGDFGAALEAVYHKGWTAHKLREEIEAAFGVLNQSPIQVTPDVLRRVRISRGRIVTDVTVPLPLAGGLTVWATLWVQSRQTPEAFHLALLTSRTTQVLLLFHPVDEGVGYLGDVPDVFVDMAYDNLKGINDWLGRHGHGRLHDVGKFFGGGNFMPDVYGGTFDAQTLDVDEFVAFVKDRAWSVPFNVQLLIRHGEERRFTEYSMVQTYGHPFLSGDEGDLAQYVPEQWDDPEAEEYYSNPDRPAPEVPASDEAEGGDWTLPEHE